MSKEHIAEALEKAADMLESEEVQWIRGDFEEELDPIKGRWGYCAMGALCKASGENWRRQHPVAEEALQYIKPYVIGLVMEAARHDTCNPDILPSIEEWNAESALLMFNDRIVEGKEQVIEVMKLAAKDVRNQA